MVIFLAIFRILLILPCLRGLHVELLHQHELVSSQAAQHPLVGVGLDEVLQVHLIYLDLLEDVLGLECLQGVYDLLDDLVLLVSEGFELLFLSVGLPPVELVFVEDGKKSLFDDIIPKKLQFFSGDGLDADELDGVTGEM